MEILLSLFIIVIVIYLLGITRTNKVHGAPEQSEFLSGTIPHRLPDGFYTGSVKYFQTPWLGKEFDRKKSMGINHFHWRGKTAKEYPFKFTVEKGLQDKEKEVIRIDYNLPKNPFWIRMIVDEIVETEPHHFLGKVHLRLPKKLIFSLGYFRLEK